MRMAWRLVLVSIAVLGIWDFGFGISLAAVPPVMNYQGKLTDASGRLVADGSYEMRFSLHDAESGGTALWTETWETPSAVPVTDGMFSALLGSHTPLSLPFDEGYWLGVEVKSGGSWETLQPRQRIASAGYAFRSEKVTDGGITNASISGMAAIDGTKISPDFGSQNLLTGGNISALTFNTTVSTAELGSLDGVTSAIQSQLDAKAPSASPAFTGDVAMPGTGLWTSSGNLGIGTTSPSEKLDVVGNLEVSGKILPGSSRLALSVSRTSMESTTSGTWTDVPGMTIAVPSTWAGGDVIILYMDVTGRSQAGRHNFRITVDGGAVAKTHVRITDIGDHHNVNMHYVGNLAAGAHSVAVQWMRVDGGTVYSAAEGVSDYSEAKLSVASIL